ncbi:helix-turn-helix transcriptional regulator [Mycobacterium sp. 1245852.3]|uniref:helix-turn-helix transcriptional regulator n=1 Tax=Mycobacterium sp. 1245852.3 TaxID=1856860 RepID=UPI000800C336|nr:helix-turn-helix transcriptional regulator [Mycobacterium sp. 1245852.3]OBK09284.1 helix-turn-helix transcriptional regulator [Mycobacterium sp. 1245852.3]
MVTVEDFSRLIAGIYAAAVTPDRWEAALGSIRRALDGTASGLFLADSTVWSVLDSTLPAAAAKSYVEYYHRFDHVLAAVGRGPVAAVRTGAELMPLVSKSEFYEEWLHPLELGDGMFVRLTGGPTPTCFIVGAPRRTESFDTFDRVKLMRGLVPHLQQAVRTQNKLAALSHTTAELADALEVVRHGIVVVVSREHLVKEMNSAAERIFRAGDGFCMRSGCIAATSAHTERELHRAIDDALRGGCSTIRAERSLISIRPSGKRPYVVHVLPSHCRDADGPLRKPKALVLIIDPEDEPEPPAVLLRRLYRLTDAEADVALRIAHGAGLKEISQELSVSVTTVRTHLQHVFDKTDTHRQAQLVRLLLVLRP